MLDGFRKKNRAPPPYDAVMRECLFRNIIMSLKPGGTLMLQGYTPK